MYLLAAYVTEIKTSSHSPWVNTLCVLWKWARYTVITIIIIIIKLDNYKQCFSNLNSFLYKTVFKNKNQ